MPEQDHDRLIRIDERLARMEPHLTKVMDDHERRVRSLEIRQWINWGAILASLAAGGAALRTHLLGGPR